MGPIQDFLVQILPSIIGSTGAALWTKGGKRRILSLWILGIAVAYYIGPWIAQLANMPETVTGLIVGFFGISVIDKIFDGISKFDLTAFIDKVINFFLSRGK